MRPVQLNGLSFASLAHVARHYGVSYQSLMSRLREGWDLERAVTEPYGHNLHTYRGESLTATQWARKLGLPAQGLVKRLQRGMGFELAIAADFRVSITPAEAAARRAAREKLRNKKITSILRAYKIRRACTDCKSTFHHEAMEFDHVRGEKKFEISKAGKRSLRAIAEEISKCDLVCANCHRLRTIARRQ